MTDSLSTNLHKFTRLPAATGIWTKSAHYILCTGNCTWQVIHNIG